MDMFRQNDSLDGPDVDTTVTKDATDRSRSRGIAANGRRKRKAETSHADAVRSRELVPRNFKGSVSELVTMLVKSELARGRDLNTGTSLISVLRAMTEPVGSGPMAKAHLAIRPARRHGCKDKIVIVEGRKVKSTGRDAVAGPDPVDDIAARVKLEEYITQKLQKALRLVTIEDLTVPEVLEEFLRDIMPPEVAKKLGDSCATGWRQETRDKEQPMPSEDRFAKHCRYAFNIGRCFKDTRLGDLTKNAGYIYNRFRKGEQNASQTKPTGPKDIKKVGGRTVVEELYTLSGALTHICEKYGRPVIRFTKPTVRDLPSVWLLWGEVIRLLLACNGFKFDENGELLKKMVTTPGGGTKLVLDLADEDEVAEFECVKRFIFLYFYGGGRHSRILKKVWGIDHDSGSIDPKTLVIHGSGIKEAINGTKRDQDRDCLGTLRKVVPVWAREDLPRDTHNIVHDLDGKELTMTRMLRLFRRVAANAGLHWLTRPHILKHSAVTLFTLAGMPIDQLATHFSTTAEVLRQDYLHLTYIWDDRSQRRFRKEFLNLLALRKFSPSSWAELVEWEARTRGGR